MQYNVYLPLRGIKKVYNFLSLYYIKYYHIHYILYNLKDNLKYNIEIQFNY